MILSVSTLRPDGIFEAGYLSPGGNSSPIAHRNGGRLVICTTYIYIYMSFISAAVTAHGQTLSSPLTYSLCHVFSLAISTPLQVAYWFIYPSRQGFYVGYRIAKGVSERCIARLLLTITHIGFALCVYFCRYNYLPCLRISSLNPKNEILTTSVVWLC